MSKTYQLKMTSAKAEAKTHDATPANGKAPTALQAQGGARYQLSDVKTGFAPDNIRVSRSGKHLKIFVDGVSEPAFVIENFYEFPIEDRLVLSGKAEDGSAYAYTPETASSAATVAQLKDDGLVAGMALGGEGNAAGAAVGLLAPVAAFNPLLLAAGALGAAGAAGGGGGGDGASSPTNNTAAKVSIEGITQDTGSSSQDFYTSDNTLTYTGKIAGYVSNGDVLKLELKNSKGEVIATETVTPKSDGTWSWIALDSNQAPRVLADGNYTLIATLVDKTDKQVNTGSDGQDTQIITIDTASDKNTDPSGADNTPSVDPNTLAAVEIKAITDDTGVSATDFYTADNTLTYTGKINGYTANDDVIKLELRNSKNETLTTSYAKPLADGQWTWQDLDASGKAVYRADGNYSLVATLVDKAGNRVNAGSSGSATQTITIDTSTTQNTDSSKLDNIPSDDTNRLASIAIASSTDDTGQSQTDFYTADNTLSYSGTLKDFSTNGDAVCLILKDIAGKVLSTNYVTPTNTNWTWVDSVARADGIYSLEANIVDKAGNVLAKAAAKTIHIDTSTTQNTNGQDPNADLTLDITGLVLSANGLRTGLADFYNNAPDQSRFKGTFSGNWVSDNDRLVLEIFDPQTGKQLAAETFTPSGNTWTSSNQFLGSRANGTYVLRATVEDQAGNTVMVDTQSFVIDKNLIAQDSIIFKPLNSDVVVTLPEGGKLTLTGQMTGKPYTYDYSGTALDLQQQLSNEAFTYTFTDYAGNTFSNGSTGSSSWSGPVKVAASTSISAADVQTSLTGDIGTYSLSTNATTLNLSAVIASKGTSAFNSIDLTGNGITSLTIKAHDLLDIGLTNCFIMGSNSFSKDQKYDSDIQFKVKGDSSDIINMTELTNTGSKVTLADGQSYAVYHTIVGSIDIDVFVLDGMKVN